MIPDFDHLPAPELTAAQQDALYGALVATITAESTGTTRRSWARRHRRLTVGVAAFIVVESTSTAVAARYLSGTATPSDSLYCYSQVSSDTGDNAPGTAVMVANPTPAGGADPGPATITDPVGLCSNLYRKASSSSARHTSPAPSSSPPTTRSPHSPRASAVTAPSRSSRAARRSAPKAAWSPSPGTPRPHPAQNRRDECVNASPPGRHRGDG